MSSISSDNYRDQNEFNDSLGYLNRLNYHLWLVSEAKREKNLSNWIDALNILYSELSTEMKDDEKIKLGKTLQNLMASINKRQNLVKINPQLFWQIQTLELALRKIFKESGLQNKVKDDPRFALHG